jgi:uncharacterized protein YdhG (YjbR/CyaY superfamily)
MEKNKKVVRNVDEYFYSLPDSVREKLEKLRDVIKRTAPEAEEVISYGMPAYKYHGVIAYIGAAKKHYALYAYPDSIRAFYEKLKPYELSKGTIKFQYDKPVPEKLVSDIIKYRVKGNIEKQSAKEEIKRKTRRKV